MDPDLGASATASSGSTNLKKIGSPSTLDVCGTLLPQAFLFTLPFRGWRRRPRRPALSALTLS